jgi:hypothetical protein
MTEYLRKWRDKYSISDYKQMAREKPNRMTVAALAGGGAICTMAAMTAGFQPMLLR